MASGVYTAAQLAALRAAIASGTVHVAYATGSVTYRSLEEMLALERIMAADVEAATTTRWSIGVYSKD